MTQTSRAGAVDPRQKGSITKMEARGCYGYYGEGCGATGEVQPKAKGTFQYEFWTVEILYDVGRMLVQYKAKDKEHAIRQIKKEIKDTNSEKNLSAPWYKRRNRVVDVAWETLTLDHVGYIRWG